MRPDEDPPRDRRVRNLLWPLLIVAVAIVFVVLHLTGVLGPGTH